MPITQRKETVVHTDTAAKTTTEKPYLVIFQIINFLLGVVEGFLLLRFILRLMGANTAAAFTQFVYGVSDLFMAPFNYIFPRTAADEFVLEWSVLLAMAVYYLLAYLIKRLVMVLYTADTVE